MHKAIFEQTGASPSTVRVTSHQTHHWVPGRRRVLLPGPHFLLYSLACMGRVPGGQSQLAYIELQMLVQGHRPHRSLTTKLGLGTVTASVILQRRKLRRHLKKGLAEVSQVQKTGLGLRLTGGQLLGAPVHGLQPCTRGRQPFSKMRSYSSAEHTYSQAHVHTHTHTCTHVHHESCLQWLLTKINTKSYMKVIACKTDDEGDLQRAPGELGRLDLPPLASSSF